MDATSGESLPVGSALFRTEVLDVPDDAREFEALWGDVLKEFGYRDLGEVDGSFASNAALRQRTGRVNRLICATDSADAALKAGSHPALRPDELMLGFPTCLGRTLCLSHSAS